NEVALMREHAIDTMVTKASGGDATRAKIDAAALIGARIIILRRPPAPDTERVLSAEDAMAWIEKKI
ncbi:MAG: precorrin-6A/cobalt-precorrin-6A reductase, partial [Sphingomonadales bacterium]|nr:precorrin-6A/cobalt-precorrin-6A reductase [Sphingomonadales bacterium]